MCKPRACIFKMALRGITLLHNMDKRCFKGIGIRQEQDIISSF